MSDSEGKDIGSGHVQDSDDSIVSTSSSSQAEDVQETHKSSYSQDEVQLRLGSYL